MVQKLLDVGPLRGQAEKSCPGHGKEGQLGLLPIPLELWVGPSHLLVSLGGSPGWEFLPFVLLTPKKPWASPFCCLALVTFQGQCKEKVSFHRLGHD